MADAYWKYGDGRQLPLPLIAQVAKRPRHDFEFPSGQGSEISPYLPREEDGTRSLVIRDTEAINASYDRYLRTAHVSPLGADTGRSASTAVGGGRHLVDEPRPPPMAVPDSPIASKGQPVGVGNRPEIPLPPDASSTLFVEGLPANCTRREVCHIFRPFVGYKEVRLLTKESRHPGGDPLVLCFVDFQSPAHAATAMDALQGYKFDETDRDSANLRLQFARNPGARSGGSHRGKR